MALEPSASTARPGWLPSTFTSVEHLTHLL